MAAKAPGRMEPDKLASDLLHQRAALVRSTQRRAELAARIREYEQRHGIKSRSIHAAIERGELKETREVCRWIMDYDLLKRTKAS